MEDQQQALMDAGRAEEYVEAVRRGRWISAVAIPPFALSALPLLLPTSMGGEEPSGWALGAGLTALLVLVAVGVVLLVLHGSRMEEFEDIDGARVSPAPTVREIARALRREHRRERTLTTGAAIMLWILAAVPVILMGVLTDSGSLAPWPIADVLYAGLWSASAALGSAADDRAPGMTNGPPPDLSGCGPSATVQAVTACS